MVRRREYSQDLIIIRSGKSWERMKRSLHAECRLNVHKHCSSVLQSGLVMALRADKKCTDPTQLISLGHLLGKSPSNCLATCDLLVLFLDCPPSPLALVALPLQ